MPVDTELNLAKSDAAASAAAGQTVLDGQDHVTAAVRAVAAASAATPSPAKPKKVSRADEIEQKEVDHLGLIAMTVRSSALRRLIYKGIDLKKEAQALWVPHGEADERSRDLRVSGATKEEMKAAELDEVATWAAWEADKAIAALLRIALPEDGVATPGGAHLPYHFNDLGVSNREGAESISTGLFRPVSNLFGTACSLFVLV